MPVGGAQRFDIAAPAVADIIDNTVIPSPALTARLLYSLITKGGWGFRPAG